MEESGVENNPENYKAFHEKAKHAVRYTLTDAEKQVYRDEILRKHDAGETTVVAGEVVPITSSAVADLRRVTKEIYLRVRTFSVIIRAIYR